MDNEKVFSEFMQDATDISATLSRTIPAEKAFKDSKIGKFSLFDNRYLYSSAGMMQIFEPAKCVLSIKDPTCLEITDQSGTYLIAADK